MGKARQIRRGTYYKNRKSNNRKETLGRRIQMVSNKKGGWKVIHHTS